MIKNAYWVIEELPNNHQEMIFFIPEFNKSNFYFLKDSSNINILNDTSQSLHKILKAFRDDKNYIKKLLKIKYNSKTFKEAKLKHKFKSENEEAINEYILYRLSKNHEGKIYQKNSLNKNSISCDIKELSNISSKLNKKTFIFNYSLKEVLKLFNNEDLIIYYSPTPKDVKSPEHLEIINILLKHYSKIIINTYDNPIYKKYFKNWIKKKKPGQNNKVKIECIWKNF